jgi:protein-S-isoprenylcysteine O-methyltransferase Ste14
MKNWQVALIGIPLGLMFAIVIPYVLSLLDPYLIEVEIGVARWLGLPLVVGGATFTIYSIIYLQRRCGGITAPTPGQQAAAKLVSTGPYSVVRHPQQAGYLLLLFGMSILLSSSLTFLYALLSSLLVVIVERRVEERRMLERHGEKYAEYQRRVPQLIPRLRLSSKNQKKKR